MNQLFYKYGKFFFWLIIFLIIFLYLFLYFYPSLNSLKAKKNQFKNNALILSEYQKELKIFKEPTKEEKLLWKKIEERINTKRIILKNEKQYLSFLSKNIKTLKSILEKDFSDFLLNIEDKNIKITQTLKDDSELKNYFKEIKDSSSVKMKKNKSSSFIAYQENNINYKKKRENNVIINMFFVSTLEKTSRLLYKLPKEYNNLIIKKITIMRKENKTFYLIALKLNIEKVYENVKK